MFKNHVYPGDQLYQALLDARLDQDGLQFEAFGQLWVSEANGDNYAFHRRGPADLARDIPLTAEASARLIGRPEIDPESETNTDPVVVEVEEEAVPEQEEAVEPAFLDGDLAEEVISEIEAEELKSDDSPRKSRRSKKS